MVGGGLHGMSAALHLARRGCRVTVLEAVRVAAHASGLSAGGVRTLGRHPAEVPLALAALEQWHAIAALVGDDCGFQASGQVKIAETASELAGLRERLLDHEELIDGDGVRQLLPAVAGHVVGGVVCRRDGFAEPYRTTLAFWHAARAAGVVLHEGARVVAAARRAGRWTVRTQDGGEHCGDVLVNAAGAWGGRLARSLGDAVPLGFNAFMMMLTGPMPAFVGPVVGAVGRAISFKQVATGQVMIGGGYRGSGDLDTGQVRLDVPRMAQSARGALALFPLLCRAQIVDAWAGIEGVTSDGLPVIGLSPATPGLVHAFGFCGHGFALGPVVGGIVAQLALDGGTNMPIGAFAVGRFAAAASASPG